MSRPLIALAICTAGLWATAPSVQAQEDPPYCTQIGCESAVYVNVAKAKDSIRRLTFCAQDRCAPIRVKRDLPSWGGVQVECSEEITVLGVLTARDSRGRKLGRYKALIPLRKTQPNGPACPPTCFQGSVRFNGARLVVQS